MLQEHLQLRRREEKLSSPPEIAPWPGLGVLLDRLETLSPAAPGTSHIAEELQSRRLQADSRIKSILEGGVRDLGNRLGAVFESIDSGEAWDMMTLARSQLLTTTTTDGAASAARPAEGVSGGSSRRIIQLCLPGLFPIAPHPPERGGLAIALIRELSRHLAGRQALAVDMANEAVIFDRETNATVVQAGFGPPEGRGADLEGLPGLFRHLSKQELWEVETPLNADLTMI